MLPGIGRFATGLNADLAAVTAGLSLPFSSGPVLGNVNRIKMIKADSGSHGEHHHYISGGLVAAVEGNLGNLLRHRLTLDACLLILGGAGLEWMWMRIARSATALTYPDSAAARSPVPQPRR